VSGGLFPGSLFFAGSSDNNLAPFYFLVKWQPGNQATRQPGGQVARQPAAQMLAR